MVFGKRRLKQTHAICFERFNKNSPMAQQEISEITDYFWKARARDVSASLDMTKCDKVSVIPGRRNLSVRLPSKNLTTSKYDSAYFRSADSRSAYYKREERFCSRWGQ